MINRGQMAAQIANARASRGGMNQLQPPPRTAAPPQAVNPGPSPLNNMNASYDSFIAQQPQMGTVTPVTLAAPKPMPVAGMAKGGKVKKMAKGGSVTRGDGMCMKGHTKGKMY